MRGKSVYIWMKKTNNTRYVKRLRSEDRTTSNNKRRMNDYVKGICKERSWLIATKKMTNRDRLVTKLQTVLKLFLHTIVNSQWPLQVTIKSIWIPSINLCSNVKFPLFRFLKLKKLNLHSCIRNEKIIWKIFQNIF